MLQSLQWFPLPLAGAQVPLALSCDVATGPSSAASPATSSSAGLRVAHARSASHRPCPSPRHVPPSPLGHQLSAQPLPGEAFRGAPAREPQPGPTYRLVTPPRRQGPLRRHALPRVSLPPHRELEEGVGRALDVRRVSAMVRVRPFSAGLCSEYTRVSQRLVCL